MIDGVLPPATDAYPTANASVMGGLPKWVTWVGLGIIGVVAIRAFMPKRTLLDDVVEMLPKAIRGKTKKKVKKVRKATKKAHKKSRKLLADARREGSDYQRRIKKARKALRGVRRKK